MKTRESGMPEEEAWNDFFDPKMILRKLKLSESFRNVVDFGCGYGTFTTAAAQVAAGTVYALDIEPEMVEATPAKVDAEGLRNVVVYLRDFVADGSGLPAASVDYAMLFNILHAEQPAALLWEVFACLCPTVS
jgi:SAM-dependent methyltransferase